MKNAIMLALGISLLTGGAANAQEKQYYAEASYVALSYTEPGYKLSPSAARLIVGSNVMDNLAVELMGAIGLASGTVSGVSLKLDNGFGAFLRPQLKLGDSAQVFGRIGYFRGALTATAGSFQIGTSGSDVAYGVGASFRLTDTASVTGDYMSYYDKSSVAITGFSVGAKFDF